MAKKKLKFPVPDVGQIWQDAFVLLQYAFRLDKNKSALDGDEAALIMLSECHHAIEAFRKSRKVSTQQGFQATMVNQLAKVYERVTNGELQDEMEYRKAIRDDAGFHADEGEPDGLEQVLGVFLKDMETIREERGPLEAAAQATAEYLRRGGRQLMEYRSRLEDGTLAFNPHDLESEGLYHLHFDFIRLVMTKTLCVKAQWVAEIQNFLKEKKIAEAKAKIDERVRTEQLRELER